MYDFTELACQNGRRDRVQQFFWLQQRHDPHLSLSLSLLLSSLISRSCCTTLYRVAELHTHLANPLILHRAVASKQPKHLRNTFGEYVGAKNCRGHARAGCADTRIQDYTAACIPGWVQTYPATNWCKVSYFGVNNLFHNGPARAAVPD